MKSQIPKHASPREGRRNSPAAEPVTFPAPAALSHCPGSLRSDRDAAVPAFQARWFANRKSLERGADSDKHPRQPRSFPNPDSIQRTAEDNHSKHRARRNLVRPAGRRRQTTTRRKDPAASPSSKTADWCQCALPSRHSALWPTCIAGLQRSPIAGPFQTKQLCEIRMTFWRPLLPAGCSWNREKCALTSPGEPSTRPASWRLSCSEFVFLRAGSLQQNPCIACWVVELSALFSPICFLCNGAKPGT